MHSQENVNEVVRNDLADIVSRLTIMEEKIMMPSQVGQRAPRESQQTEQRRSLRRRARHFKSILSFSLSS